GGQANFLYRNNGDFTFTEVAASWQIDDVGCGLGVTTTDLNNDGRMDLYVANDFGNQVEPNEHFQNNLTGFTRRSANNGTAATINAMGIAKGDYDADGDLDLYITNIRENPLFENTDGGNFFNFASFTAGVALPELTSWGTSFTDFDLDGWLDLVVANGQVAELVNVGEAQRYYRNNGDGTFSDRSISSGLDEIVVMGRGLAVADYDLDGYPDVVIQVVQTDRSGDEQLALLHNEGGTDGQWLAVETPADAQRLTLYAGAQSWMREIDGGSSYLSHTAGPVHFGAPAGSAPIDSLVVTFTNQPARTFTDLAWNKLTGLRPDGSTYLIEHAARIECANEASPPTITSAWGTNAETQEVLYLERTETLPYPILPEEVVELSLGEQYQGVARTQDAMLVDTIAMDGPCPSLRPIQLKVLPANQEPLVYPNPLSGELLTVLLPTAEAEVEVALWNVAGQLVSRQSLTLSTPQRTVPISLPGITPGLYLLSVEAAGKTTYHKILHP
ncbi:MAG: FG-GAP-like repeat-containing protein, partial [Bacteroidota bacterium]